MLLVFNYLINKFYIIINLSAKSHTTINDANEILGYGYQYRFRRLFKVNNFYFLFVSIHHPRRFYFLNNTSFLYVGNVCYANCIYSYICFMQCFFEALSFTLMDLNHGVNLDRIPYFHHMLAADRSLPNPTNSPSNLEQVLVTSLVLLKCVYANDQQFTNPAACKIVRICDEMVCM